MECTLWAFVRFLLWVHLQLCAKTIPSQTVTVRMHQRIAVAHCFSIYRSSRLGECQGRNVRTINAWCWFHDITWSFKTSFQCEDLVALGRISMKGMANIGARVIHDVDFWHFSERVNYVAGVAVN
jgi:hypothetical protein